MPINCALSCWWYDVSKMIGKKITLKMFLFSINVNLLKHCFNILSRCLFACFYVFLASFQLSCSGSDADYSLNSYLKAK